MGKGDKEDKRDVGVLRVAAGDAVKQAKREQIAFWSARYNDVLTAQVEFQGRINRLIFEKLNELANPSVYPLWMDAVLAIMTTLVPVSAIFNAVVGKLANSRRLLLLAGKVERRVVHLKDAKQLTQVMRDWKFLQGKGDLSAATRELFRVGRALAPEAEDNLRTLVGIGAKAIATPMFDGSIASIPTPANQGGGALPATSVFKGLLDWITMSQAADEAMLDGLLEAVTASQDVEVLDSIPGYVSDGEVTPKTAAARQVLDRNPPEVFMRFVEACLWCTTFDFTPTVTLGRTRTFDPPSSANREGDGPYEVTTKTMSKVFPFSADLWDYFISRHYDPFLKGGSKTYKEIGYERLTGQQGPFPFYSDPAIGSAIEGGMTFEARARLSWDWSTHLAPAILDANVEITKALDGYLNRGR